MNKPNTLNIGVKVQITPYYPDPTLRGRNGIVIALPDKEHRDEYLVRLVDGPSRGRPVWVSIGFLQVT